MHADSYHACMIILYVEGGLYGLIHHAILSWAYRVTSSSLLVVCKLGWLALLSSMANFCSSSWQMGRPPQNSSWYRDDGKFDAILVTPLPGLRRLSRDEWAKSFWGDPANVQYKEFRGRNLYQPDRWNSQTSWTAWHWNKTTREFTVWEIIATKDSLKRWL